MCEKCGGHCDCSPKPFVDPYKEWGECECGDFTWLEDGLCEDCHKRGNKAIDYCGNPLG